MTQATIGHLEYYTRHGINPVRYEMGEVGRHFDRRASLYRGLGVTPLAVRGARVLEVAPGTGQNSLYLAHLEPASLTLVEPNPVAVRDIRALYAAPGAAPVQPALVESTFQDFNPAAAFDLVVCENWLGNSAQERGFLRKLGRLVAPRGLLVVTTVSPLGVLPNALRKALTCRLDDPAAPFADRTAVLCDAFGPHLRTIPAMTRSVTDWVHDNVMNPAYFGVILTIPMVLDDLGETFDVLGSNPRFAADWRWFKALSGPAKEFNRHFLAEYHRNLHNFFDHRVTQPERDGAANAALDAAAWEACERIREMELAFHAGRPVAADAAAVDAAVSRVVENLVGLNPGWAAALEEFRDLFARPGVSAEQVGGMNEFGPLFGRETVYVSFEQARP